jgi:hypothetical protein
VAWCARFAGRADLHLLQFVQRRCFFQAALLDSYRAVAAPKATGEFGAKEDGVHVVNMQFPPFRRRLQQFPSARRGRFAGSLQTGYFAVFSIR